MPNDGNDQNDSLWELMGEAREPRISPFFARNVIREARALEPAKPRGIWWKWALPVTAALAVSLGGVFWHSSREAGAGSALVNGSELSETFQASADYEVITELDTLLAVEENNIWLDTYASN